MAATCVAHVLTHVFTILHVSLLVLIGTDFLVAEDFGIGREEEAREQAAFYFMILGVCFGVGSIPAGWLSDQFGEKLLLILFFLGCALGGTIIGFSESWQVLTVGCVILGLATSIYHPVGTSLISKGVEKKGMAMGINGIAGSLGTALGPLLASFFSTDTTWRWAYFSVAGFTLVFTVVFLFMDLGPAAFPKKKRQQNGEIAPPPKLQRSKVIILALLLLAMTCGGVFYHVYTTTLPSHLTPQENTTVDSSVTPESNTESSAEQKGSQEAKLGGALTALVLTFGILGQFAAGYLADKREKLRLYMINYFLIIPSVLILAFLSGAPLVAMACLGSIFFFAVQPIENTLIADYSPPQWRGSVYGLKFVLVFAVGGTGTYLAPWLMNQGFSTSSVFLIATPMMTLATFAAIFAFLYRER